MRSGRHLHGCIYMDADRTFSPPLFYYNQPNNGQKLPQGPNKKLRKNTEKTKTNKTKNPKKNYNHDLLLSWMLFACCVFNLMICMAIRYISSPPQAQKTYPSYTQYPNPFFQHQYPPLIHHHLSTDLLTRFWRSRVLTGYILLLCSALLTTA